MQQSPLIRAAQVVRAIQDFPAISPSTQKQFDTLILPHRGALTIQARRLMRGSLAEADDLVQETLVRAYTRMHTISCEETIRGWLYAILKNIFLNYYRKQTNHPVLSLDALPEERTPSAGNTTNPDREVMRQFEYQATLSALATLPAVYREPVALASIAGMSYQEIAEHMDIPTNTVRSRISRGRARIRRALYAWGVSGE